MNFKLIIGAALITAGAVYVSPIVQGGASTGMDTPPALPNNPAVELPVELVYAQPFELVEPATHYWRFEQPSYTSGLLLVVQAEAAFLAPRQTAEPVLFVGSQTAERVNTGYPSGQLVVIVPGMTMAELADAPIFFGQADLPENVDALRIASEVKAARGEGITGPGSARVAAASNVEMIGALDLGDLHFQATYLIEKYSPEERDLVEGLRVPRL